MNSWLVAGAVIEAERLGAGDATDGSGLLLVENERRGGRRDWSTPGGVIDEGESSRAGLAREVQEETGLVVVSWLDMLYEVIVEAPDLGWHLRVEVHRAEAVAGTLSIGEDPDGIVVNAGWVDRSGCGDLLSSAPRWVSEPLLDWVVEGFTEPRGYSYLVTGTSLDDLRVNRRVT